MSIDDDARRNRLNNGRQSETSLGQLTLLERSLLVLRTGVELDARSDVVNVLGQMLRNVVPAIISECLFKRTLQFDLLITGDVNMTCLGVLPLVVLGAKKASELLSSQIKLHPLLIDTLAEFFNTSRTQPLGDSLNSSLTRCEKLVDLVDAEMLTIPRGVVTRDLHEKVMASVKVGLGQTDTDGQQVLCRNIPAPDPISGSSSTLLVQDMRV